MVKGASAVLSKARRNNGIARPVTKLPSGGAAPSAAMGWTSVPGGSARDVFPPAGDGQQPGAGAAPRRASRRALKNWRVRSRLLLLVIIPTVTALAAGGIFIASSVESALVDQRVLTLADLSGKITGLVQALQTEREDTIRFIVMGAAGGGRGSSPSPELEQSLLNRDYALTTSWANQVKGLSGQINGSYSALAQQDTQAVVTAIGNLRAIRAAATGTQLPALNVIEEYATTINTLLAVESQITVGNGDSTLAGLVRVLGLVSSMKEEASQEQALLTSALTPDLVSLRQFGPTQQSAIKDALAQQQGNLNEFDTAATADQRQQFNNVLSSSNVVQAQAQEQQAISLVSSRSPIATDPTISDASSALSYVVNGMRSVEQQFANSVIARSGSLHDGAITSAALFSLAAALLLAIALTATIVVGRSMVGPLRRLRNGALEVAEARLPDTVRRVNEPDAEGVLHEIEPIDVDSFDEIGEVARAFDQVHKEAVRLAANEAALRGNVNAMFVNLSRRSQSLVERLIRVVTQLEQGEQDSERLARLFQVDHLATRMRRNSENLLVLAGHEFPKRWGNPVALVDVVRAAVSEIDQYERISLNVQGAVSVHREAVRDVVHLIAELAENATSFSAADTPVTIVARVLNGGDAMIEITDQGVGMKADDLATANWRLDNPPMVDVAVSRRMGLFVVARLAARHGIRVRLRPATVRGLSGLVWLPAAVITPEQGSPAPLRSGWKPFGDRAIASAAAPATGISDPRDIPPPWEAGQDAGDGWDNTPPAPRPVPIRENPGTTGSGQYPVQDTGALAAKSRGMSGSLPTRSGPLPRIGNSGHAAGLGADGRVYGASADLREDAQRPAVVVPSLDSVAHDDRLPIYDAVESAWFRRGKQAMPKTDQGSWSSPADEGWHAAEVAPKPTSDGTTRSGLPRRAPGANLIPGTAADPAAIETAPRPAAGRSASVNRDRLAGFQRGIRQGRAEATSGNRPSALGPSS